MAALCNKAQCGLPACENSLWKNTQRRNDSSQWEGQQAAGLKTRIVRISTTRQIWQTL